MSDVEGGDADVVMLPVFDLIYVGSIVTDDAETGSGISSGGVKDKGAPPSGWWFDGG